MPTQTIDFELDPELAGLSEHELRTRAESFSNKAQSALYRAEAILATNRATNEPLSQEEQEQLAKLTAAADDAMEQHDIVSRHLEACRSQGRRTDPDSGSSISHPLPRQGRSSSTERAAPFIDLAAPVARPSYARLFGAHRRGDLPQNGFQRFLNAVAVRDSQYLLQRPQAASTLTGVDGGFAVDTFISAALFDSVVAQSQFLRYCRVVPLQGQDTSFPILNFSDRSKGPGEFVAEKIGQGSAAIKQAPKMREIKLHANKRVIFWTCTSELLQDTIPGTDKALIQAAAGAVAMAIDREIVSGDGVNAILGITNAAARIVVAKDSGQPGNSVSFTNLTNMISRLLGPSWKNAVWFVNQTTLPALFSVYNPVMNSTNVVGGLPAPLTQGADGSYRLFGLPLVVSDFLPVLSSEADIQLVDLSRFVVGIREDLRIEVSQDFLFSSDEISYRVIQRRDGMPIDDKAITPAVGSTTVSPLVCLGAR